MRGKTLSIGVVAVIAIAWTMAGRAADKNRDWPAYAGDKGSTKYSSLDQINKDTIKNLKIAWRRSGMPEEMREQFPNTQAPANYQHTPLMVDGVLYISTAVGAVAALDPATGKTLWFDALPPRPDGQGPARGAPTRGIAYWTDGRDSRILANVGANLVALNAKTGKRYNDFGDNGQVDLTKGFERPITGWRWSSGPLVVKDVVVIAGVPSPATDILNERAKAPKEMPPDDVRGFDVRTGKLLWTFHVVPRKGEFGNETWLNDSASYSGNSGAWSLISGDEELGYVYLPFEEATGDYYGGTRPGNNLFAESIMCLDAKTGKRVWHFQTLHHGIWDYDLPAAPVLADITVNGRRIKAVAQVSKQAYVYVLDRVTGAPVWPIEERPVPQGNVPGEWYSPTQPIPTKPPPFDQQGVSEKDLIDFTPELKAEALKIVSEYKYGPVYTPPVLKGSPEGPKGTILMPGTNGGADWGGASFDKETGILYVPSAHLPTIIALGKSEHPESTLPYVKQTEPRFTGPQGLPDPFKPPYSRLVAIDLNKGDILWSVANGDGLRNHPAFKGLNLPPLGTPGRLAALVTKTFVFMGEGSDSGVGVPPGYGGKMFRAFDKKTGRIAWEMELPAGISNAPMTYMVNGKQFILVAVSGRQMPGEFVALALP
ncbi:MAG: pyrroloquinoline quinone-dependent dehydrogenase [Acidobacteriota bacterium]